MRTTITLDDDVYQAAVHLARNSGQRLGKVVSVLMRRGLSPPGEVKKRRKQRFPTVEVPVGAPVIPAARIQRFIDDEGYI